LDRKLRERLTAGEAANEAEHGEREMEIDKEGESGDGERKE
jgi:hypothetical protein